MTAPVSPLRLPGFEYRRMDVDGVVVNHAIAGSGPPLLLLHGYPQNHLMWRHVAPALAEDHTVVLADLRGCGDSGKPAPDAAVLALWGTQAFVGRGYEPLSVWQQYPPTPAAPRCPPVTSCPKRHQIWSPPPCVTSSADARDPNVRCDGQDRPGAGPVPVAGATPDAADLPGPE